MSQTLVVLLLLCGVALGEYYNNTAVLNEDYSIFWNIVGDEIHLKLKVKTVGWVKLVFETEIYYSDWFWNW